MNRRRTLSRPAEVALWAAAALLGAALLVALLLWRAQDPAYRAAVARQLTLAADWPTP